MFQIIKQILILIKDNTSKHNMQFLNKGFFMFKLTNMQKKKKYIRKGANTFSHHCIYIYIKTFSLQKCIILFSINLKTF